VEKRQHFICLNSTLTIWQHLRLLTPRTPLYFSPPSPILPLDFSLLSSPLPPSPTVHLFTPAHLHSPAVKFPPCLLPSAHFWRAIMQHVCTTVCVCVCVSCRSMGTGLFGCQLESGLTCASNVVYCPKTSPEEHLRCPLKFRAIYHHLPPPSPPHPPPLCVSHHPSLPPPSPHAVTFSSFPCPPSSLIPPSRSITSIRSPSFA